MRALILIAYLILPLVSRADPISAASAALDFDQASAVAAHEKIEASNIPIPGCFSCAAGWQAQKAALLALKISQCQSNYLAAPEYAAACSTWWRTVLQ